MPDEPVSDVISGGRDPDRRLARPWRLIAGVTAAVLMVSAAALHLILAGSHHPPRRKAQAAPSSVALTAPPMLHGTPLPPGGAPSTRLFLGGDQLQLLNVGGRATAALTTVLLGAAAAGDPLGSDPAVQQITSAAGGIVALVFSHGSAGLPDIGDVIFVPAAGTSGTGAPRIIARANYIALAPNRRDIWAEQAAPPWGNGPAGSPAWLVDEDGHRLTGTRDLGSRALVAATVHGLFVRGPDQRLVLIDASNGATEPTGIPGNAIIAGADADDVAWQAATCAAGCPLHITDLRGRPGTQFALPPGTVIDPNDTSDFDPAASVSLFRSTSSITRGWSPVPPSTSRTSAPVRWSVFRAGRYRWPTCPQSLEHSRQVPATSSRHAGLRMARDCGSSLPTGFTSRWPTGPATAHFRSSGRRPAWPTNSTSRGPAQLARELESLMSRRIVSHRVLTGPGRASQVNLPPLGGRGRTTVVLNLVLIGLAITLSPLW